MNSEIVSDNQQNSFEVMGMLLSFLPIAFWILAAVFMLVVSIWLWRIHSQLQNISRALGSDGDDALMKRMMAD